MTTEEVFKKVLDCSFKVHTSLGPGLLESAYLECLYFELLNIKSIEALGDIHMAQILTYMKLTSCRLVLPVNFNVLHLKEGIKRVII